MPKITPKHSPLYYQRIAKASYFRDEESCKGFLAKNAPDVEFLDRKDIDGWQIVLFRNKTDGELAVGFEGTETEFREHPIRFVSNWITNVRRQAGGTSLMGALISPMGCLIETFNRREYKNTIETWEKAFGRKAVFVPHSGGCDPATAIAEDRTVVSFNGHKAERGENRINLAMSGDPLTQRRLLSVPNRYILVDGNNPQGKPRMEDHGIDAFESYLKDKQWTDLSSTKFARIETESQSFITEPGEAGSRFSLEYQRQAQEAFSIIERDLALMPSDVHESQLCVEQIKDALDQVSPQELIEKMEGSLASAQGLQLELDSRWRAATRSKNPQIILNVLESVHQIAGAMYRDQQQSLANTKHQLQMRRWEKDVKKHIEKLRKAHHADHVDLSLPEMQRAAMHAIHPQGSINSRLHEMRQFVSQYKQANQDLQELLREREARKQQLNGLDGNLDRLDSAIKKNYRNLLASRQKISGALRKTATGLSIASAVLALTPGGQPFSAAATIASKSMAVAATVADLGNSVLGKKTAKIESKYQRALNKNVDIREQLAQAASRNTQEMASIHAQQNQQRAILMGAADYSVPHEFREALQRADHDLKKQVADYQNSISSKCDEIKDLERDIAKLEKTERKRQEDLDNTKKKDKDGKKRRKERLQKTQQTLLERRASLISLQQQVSAERSVLRDLHEDNEKLDKLKKQEAELAPIKDFFYEAVSDEAKKWEEIDKETRKWREAIEKGLADFNLARDTERRLVYGSMTAMNQLCSELIGSPLTSMASHITGLNFGWGTLQAQTAIGLGEQVYKLHDLYKTWEKANEAIDITLKELQKTNPEARVEDALNKLGNVFYISHYIIPSLQIVTVGLSCFKLGIHLLNGSPRVESAEERRFKELGEFLVSFSKHVDEQFNELHKRLDRDHKETIETLSLVRSEMGILHQEVVREIESARDRVIHEVHSSVYHSHASSVREKSKNISLSLAAFLDRSKSILEKEKQIKNVVNFLDELKRLLDFETTFEVNSGTLISRGETGSQDTLKPIVEVGLIAQNPDIYTGLLASSLGYRETKTPCLHLLLPLLESYQSAFRAAQLLGINPEDEPRFQEVAETLQKQAKDIFDLAANLESVIDGARSKQDEVIGRLRTRMQTIRRIKKEYQLECVKGAIERQSQLLTDLTQSLTGDKKFFYGNVFCRQKIGDSYSVDHLTLKNMMIGDAPYIGYAAAYGLGSLVVGGGPLLAVAACKVGFVACLSAAGYNDIVKARDIVQWSFNQRTIIDLTKQPGETLPNKYRALMIHLWISEAGKISTTIQENWGFGTAVGVNNESKKKSPFHSVIWITRESVSFYQDDEWKLETMDPKMSESGRQYLRHLRGNHSGFVDRNGALRRPMQTSLIKIDEVEKMEPKLHTAPPEYNRDLQILAEDYKEWLLSIQKGSPLQKENTFTAIQQRARVITCKDSRFIPLAFPQNLIDSLSAKLRQEMNQMEVTAVGTLLPFYQIEECSQTKARKIKIIFDFVEGDHLGKRVPYAEFLVGEIDKDTIYTFASPTLDSEQKENAPNLNEMLLQAMYTNLYPSLGMPGDKSVFLAGGKWLAPSERSFPGFFALWEKEPSKAIHFSLRNYTQKLEEEANLVASDKAPEGSIYGTLLKERNAPVLSANYMEIFKKTRAGKIELEKAKEELKENYQLLWAYCCFVSGLDQVSLRASIEADLGILNPADFDWIVDRISWDLEPDPITERGIDRFEKLLENVPNQSIRELKETLKELRKA